LGTPLRGGEGNGRTGKKGRVRKMRKGRAGQPGRAAWQGRGVEGPETAYFQ